MLKIRALNDVHMFSPVATHDFDQVDAAMAGCPKDRRLALLGDIVDIRNARHQDVALAIDQANRLKQIALRYGAIWVRGNHELNMVAGPDFQIADGVWFCHGDIEFWGEKKSNDFRGKSLGAGWLKRHIAINLIDDFRGWLDPGPNDVFREFVASLQKSLGIRKIVCGHRHPKENISGSIGDVEFLILKRGIQDLDV